MLTEIYLARRYIFRGRSRHISFIGIISCLGVAVGVAALIIAFSIVNGIDGGLMKRIMRFQDHLVIDSLIQQELVKAKKELNNWDEVEIAYFSLNTQVFAKFSDTIVPLAVRGIDFSDQEAKALFYQYVKKEFSQDGFFVGEGLGRQFFIDKKIEFYPLEKSLNLKRDKVRGVFKVGLYDIDNYYLIADLAKAKSLSPNYSLFLGVKLKDPYQADLVKDKLLNNFSKKLFVSSWIDSNQALFATLKLEKLALFIILGLIIIVASFNIFSALTVKVVEKTKDIGILRALGFKRSSLRAIFTLGGVMIGFIGVALGSLIGVGTCLILQKYPFIRIPAEVFGTEYLPIALSLSDVISIVLVGLVISFVSSLLPAYRASKLNICEALRYE